MKRPVAAGRGLLVGVIMAGIVVSAMVMVGFIWYRWSGVREPTSAVIIEGDASLVILGVSPDLALALDRGLARVCLGDSCRDELRDEECSLFRSLRRQRDDDVNPGRTGCLRDALQSEAVHLVMYPPGDLDDPRKLARLAGTVKLSPEAFRQQQLRQLTCARQ